MLRSQRKRVAIAIVVVAVDVVLVVAEEVVTTVLEIQDRKLKAEDAEATVVLLEDLQDVRQTLNLVVEAIFQEHEKAVGNKPTVLIFSQILD